MSEGCMKSHGKYYLIAGCVRCGIVMVLLDEYQMSKICISPITIVIFDATQLFQIHRPVCS